MASKVVLHTIESYELTVYSQRRAANPAVQARRASPRALSPLRGFSSPVRGGRAPLPSSPPRPRAPVLAPPAVVAAAVSGDPERKAALVVERRRRRRR